MQLDAKPVLSLPIARYIGISLSLVLLALLMRRFGSYVVYAVTAITYPFELDYGEGIIWQQALLIPSERMYGDINNYPFIVFHYPPIYHLAVRAVAFLGFDYLSAGRGLSVLSTLAIAILIFAITFQGARDIADRHVRLIAAAIAALTIFTYVPVIYWSPKMRVDMLGIAFSFLGVYLALQSIKQPRSLYFAVLAFVAAIYTKQTLLAAPVATLSILLLNNPKQTLKAICLGFVVSMAILLYLMWKTDGGFLRHLILYNINRFSLAQAIAQKWGVEKHWIYLLLVIFALVIGWWRILTNYKLDDLNSIKQQLRNNKFALLLMTFTLYFIITTVMLINTAKLGSSVNYFIEWMCVWSVFIGILVCLALQLIVQAEIDMLKPLQFAAAIGLPMVIIYQVLLAPKGYIAPVNTVKEQQMRELLSMIHASNRPVLSDDMVLLIKAGKEVPIEPAIFTELAHAGRWNEQRVLNMIESQFFEFVVSRDTRLDSECYTQSVQNAIKSAYPRTLEYGEYQIHLPFDWKANYPS